MFDKILESFELAKIVIKEEPQIVEVRQMSRDICSELGFSQINQVRITTAVSEIARNIYEYAGSGTITFSSINLHLKSGLHILCEDTGPGITDLEGILQGKYKSKTGLGVGIKGAKALMDEFEITSQPGEGTRVVLVKWLPAELTAANKISLKILQKTIARKKQSSPDAAIKELQAQNRDLVDLMRTLEESERKLKSVNEELVTTNLGIVALNNEMNEKNALLGELNRKLQSKNEDLKGFAYTVSHDLKAPLRGISGYAQELEREHSSGLSGRALFCVKQVITATKNLDKLIEDLLHYSRLEQEVIQIAEVNMQNIVDSILNDRARILQELEVHVEKSIEAPLLLCWERGIVQVLTNLIDNAVKYSKQSKPPSVQIKTLAQDEKYLISVVDNGIGFDMKYHDRIFGLFNRLVRAEEFEGTGAGLAIVKKLVEKQQGRVWAESEPGKGATFFVELPVGNQNKLQIMR